MAVVINGTTGISGVAGSAGTPAYQGTDTDSGFFINSANEPSASVNGTSVWNGASTFGFKNRLINGAMVIDQRNAGAAVTVTNAASSFFGVDRFFANRANGYGLSTSTVQQVSDAPAGFVKSVKYTNSTAETPTGSFYSNLQQYIEGNNIADFGWGTANAKPATLSFWVKISVTGTFGVVLRAGNAGASYAISFTYSSANTWQYVTATIPGPTIGVFNTDNTVGFSVNWDLGVGPSLCISATGAWQATNALGLTGGTKVNSTAGATYQITGAQLELGTVATSFDYRPYGTELQLCQRYALVFTYDVTNPIVFTGYWGSATSFEGFQYFPVPMRVQPTISVPTIGSLYCLEAQIAWRQASSISIGEGGPLGVKVAITAATNSTFVKGQGGTGGLRAAGTVQFSAEL